jgi:hypothetical protein
MAFGALAQFNRAYTAASRRISSLSILMGSFTGFRVKITVQGEMTCYNARK